jgi:hypothetical protein
MMLVWKRLVRLAVASGVLFVCGSAMGRLLAAPHTAAPRLAADEKAPDEDTRKPTDAELKAATTAIEAQLKAFKADDYERALKYQSEDLRDNFESAAEFRRMMRKSYPEFANYKSIIFGEARATKNGEAIRISVTVTGMDRVVVKAVYVMVREKGEYKVGGVGGGTQPDTPKRDVA